MKRVIGICNLHDSPKLKQLTRKHPLGAVTFLGRYALMDFTLSNFSNSEIDRVAILVESGVQSIQSHVRDGQVWIRNTRTGFQRLCFNEKDLSSPRFNTDVNNILTNISFFKEHDADYYIVAPAFFIMSINYQEIIDTHIANGSDITIVYTHSHEANAKYQNCDQIVLDKENNVNGLNKFNNKSSEADISLEACVISKEAMVQILESSSEISEIFSLRDLIKYHVENKTFKIKGFEFKGEVFPILSFEDYVKYSFRLLSYKERKKLFLDNWPIYTTTHNTPPALYGKNSDVSNSFIANGSIIKGKVRNSIISRDVVIENGAEVENCILFTNTEIGENVKLSYAVTDKYVKVIQSKENIGDEDNILFIRSGVKI